MVKHVLVTGAGGSIGCHVMEHLLEKTDWQITAIDSFRHKGLSERLHDKLLYSPRVRIFRHDLASPISNILANRIGSLNYVINLAAISDVDVSLDDPAYAIRTNTDIMLTMGQYFRDHLVYDDVTFLHVSTDEVYGPTDGVTTHKEWDPIVPSNPYSASKACQESIGIAYWRSYGLPLIIVNIMNNFGERQNGAKFPCIVQRALRRNETITLHRFKDGYGSRYYIHSRNAADAMLFILRNVPPYPHAPGFVDKPHRFNIVGDLQVDNRQLVETIAGAMGIPWDKVKVEDLLVTDQRPGHDGHYGLDGSLLYSLGWRPPMTFHQSMVKCVQWYQENPAWLDPR